MKKLFIPLVVLSFLFFSCNDKPENPSPTVTKTVVQEAPAVSDETLMVSTIRAKDSWFNDVSDYQIIDVAKLMCSALQSGSTIEEVGIIAIESIGQEHAIALIAGAITYLCPEQESKITS